VILDTNSLSAFADGLPAAVSAVNAADSVEVSVISLGEFRFGIAQSKHRIDYERWLRENLRFYRIVDVNEETASVYAEIRLELKQAGRPIPVNDLWIAALCRQRDQPILSRDRHFDVVKGVRRVGW
jgi:tRNA(fMet)-specific endonuclease VapC